MSDKPEGPKPEDIDSIRARAKVAIDEIGLVRSKFEEQLKAMGVGVDVARKNVDDQVDNIRKAVASIQNDLKAAEDLKGVIEATRVTLSEIKSIRTQSEEQLKAAETARRSADEHASYANQAKVNTEGHSKATAVFKGTAEADTNAIATNKQKGDELLAALIRGKADVDADVKAMSERKKEVDQSAQGIIEAAKDGTVHLQTIIASKTSAEASLKQVEEKRDEAVETSRQADLAKAKIDQLATQADTLLETVTSAHDSSADLSGKIVAILQKAEQDQVAIAGVLKHLNTSEAIAKGYEERITKNLEELDKLIQRATGLLPGFASASLAHSFNEAKSRFAIPQRRWLWTFIICIGALIAVAVPSFYSAVAGSPPDQWGPIFRGMALRLPILIPLVWLAIYAGRNYMLSVRLEEDYAYKEALSKAFEGYKREMENIAVDSTMGPAPLTTLCINILSAIAERPGRIYEGHHRDVTPFNEARNVAEKAVSLSQKQIAEE